MCVFTSTVEKTSACWVISDVSKDLRERWTTAIKNLAIQLHESLVTPQLRFSHSELDLTSVFALAYSSYRLNAKLGRE